MNTEPTAIEMTWYDIHRVRLSREYLAGGLAGLGLGIVVMAGATDLALIRPGWTPIVIPGFALVALGSFLARRTQSRSTTDRKTELD